MTRQCFSRCCHLPTAGSAWWYLMHAHLRLWDSLSLAWIPRSCSWYSRPTAIKRLLWYLYYNMHYLKTANTRHLACYAERKTCGNLKTAGNLSSVLETIVLLAVVSPSIFSIFQIWFTNFLRPSQFQKSCFQQTPSPPPHTHTHTHHKLTQYMGNKGLFKVEGWSTAN